MRPIDQFWNHVRILQEAMRRASSPEQIHWWRLRLSNFMLKLESYENKALN